ncbi:hypothetical protein AVEN_148082-1 [Araneus ventricosus]|uniref:Uncharacterized protein n=1 Tax=Araneus ventricosus TaxID=182803 RepID=A0A4Y2G967_ARAVE|nr:hypothetical protein AVEN_148082-1 [Araneus ventricosus]
MAGDTMAQASVTRFRSSCNVCGGVAYTRCLMYPHRQKSNGFRSGERGGHSTQPPYPMAYCWRGAVVLEPYIPEVTQRQIP